MTMVRIQPGHPIALAALAVALVCGGCGSEPDEARTPDPVRVFTLSDTVTIVPGAERVHLIRGLDGPESVRYDPEQDVFFVSSMAGEGSDRDGNGYIVRVSAADPSRAEVFVRGGRNGAMLDAPKGLAILGDVLWVADIDVVRGFHRRTGAPLGTIDLRPHGAVLLNDVAVGPDGRLWVTDTGIRMTSKGVLYPGGDKIFSLSPAGDVRVVARSPELRNPNGITWDARNNRWLVATFHPHQSSVYALGTAGARPTRDLLAFGPGRFDGIEVLADGRMVVTCWKDYSVHLIGPDTHTRIITNLIQPADLGVDTRRNRLLIPLVLYGHVEIWTLPPGV